MPIDEKTAADSSSFVLTWALMLTLLRKRIISTDDVISSLELSRDPTLPSAAIDELIGILEKLSVDREDN